MFKTIAILLLLITPCTAGNLTDQLLWGSTFTDDLKHQQQLQQIEQDFKMRAMQSEIDSLRRQQNQVDDVNLLLYILKYHPELLRK